MSYYDGPSGPSTNYAEFNSRGAYLSEGRFPLSMCQYFFGLTPDMVEALVGRYIRGKRKGLLRGYISWTKCVHGGWVSGRGLCGRGVTEAYLSKPVGWDARHGYSIDEVLIRWSRRDGISYE